MKIEYNECKFSDNGNEDIISTKIDGLEIRECDQSLYLGFIIQITK